MQSIPLALLLAAAMLAPADDASARAGRLDPSYGVDGMTATELGIAGFEPEAELTVDGSAAFVGDGGAGTGALFTSSGSLDGRFARHGVFALSSGNRLLEIEGRKLYPGAITIDRRHRILVFGDAVHVGGEVPETENAAPYLSLAAVARFGPRGHLDHSFGSGRGFMTGRFGFGTYPDTEASRIGVSAGIVDSRDRPVFVVTSVESVGGCEGGGTVEAVPRGVARLTSSGSVDKTFGTGGAVSIYGRGDDPILDLDGADRPVVDIGGVGSYAARCGEGSILYRFDRDGSPVRGFGDEGKTLKSMHLAIVQPSGATVLDEARGSTVEVERLRPDGYRERGFGRGGIAVVRLPRKSADAVPAAVDGRGRILLVGAVRSSGAGKAGRTSSSIVVGRLLPDGRLDRSFGTGGWLLSRLPRGLELLDTDAALDARGRLLVGGFVTARRSHDVSGGFVVARFLVGP